VGEEPVNRGLRACAGLLCAALAAQDDVADVPAAATTTKDGARWFLIGANGDRKPPDGGYGVVVVLPGGDGSEEFHTFVKRLWKQWLPRGYLVVQLVSREAKDAPVIWPTARKVGRARSTEAVIGAVLQQLRAVQEIDPTRVFTLSWSSGGPAAYAASLDPGLGIRGSLIAMSVFHENELGKLAAAKGHAYYLLHSPSDDRCRFRDAERARDVLGKNGARVRLVPYEGGHVWNAASLCRLAAGIRFLEGERPLPDGKDLLRNGGFEDGLAQWQLNLRSGTAEAAHDEKVKHAGNGSLRVAKTGAMPPDLVAQRIDALPATGRLVVCARVRCEAAQNAWLKFRIRDANGKDLVEDVDVAHLAGTQEFELVRKDYDVPAGAKTAHLELMMVAGGTVWLDDVAVLAIGAGR
jgi:predicted esterase